MATTDHPPNGLTEFCESCERDTPHEVTIQFRTEAAGSEYAAYSREPYRVTECRCCRARSSQRMNDA